MQKKLFYLSTLLALLVLLIHTSCSQEQLEAKVPAYLHIPSFKLETDYASEGTAHSDFTTVWVFYNDEAVGAFPLPCTIPIIPKEGAQNITIYPGITMNGIDATRAIYAMCESVTESFTLSPLDTFRFNNSTTGIPVTRYAQQTKISIIEDFNDDNGLNLEPTNASDTNVIRITDPNLIFSFPDDNETQKGSGLLSIARDTSRVEIISSNTYVLPRSRDVYLELTYKSNNSMLIGLVANEGVKVTRSTLFLKSSNNEWKKIYVNYINEIGPSNQGTAFNVIFGVIKDPDVDTAKVFVDNMKLVYP